MYHQSFQTRILLDKVDANMPLTLNASYQGCSDKGLCYPPIDKIFNVDFVQTVSATPAEFAVAKPISPDNDNTQIAKLFKGGSFWLKA